MTGFIAIGIYLLLVFILFFSAGYSITTLKTISRKKKTHVVIFLFIMLVAYLIVTYLTFVP